ncbi:MAG: ABC transporter ATP-binding protein/permease [Nitrospinae bacterium]|nr:ABC transporter ATP-binding protein/permease [Nitrospinota bacterium]
MNIEEIFKKYQSGSLRNDVSVFWQLSTPYLWRLLAAVVCSLMLSGINGAIAWIIKPVLDTIFIKKSSNFLFLLPFGIIILFFMRGAFTYITNYLMSSIGAKIVRSLRQGIYNKLLFLPLSFYGKTSSGSVVSKSLNDVEILNLTVAHTIKDFFVAGGTVIALAIVAVIRKWDLALLSFIVVPLIVYGISKFGVMMKRVSMNTRKLISKITTILHESLQGMKIIKAFTMEEEMNKRHEKALAEHYRNTMREVRINESSSLLAELLGGFGIAIILFYGGHLVISDDISAGSFFSFIAAILMMYTPLKRLSRVNNNFQQARNVIERIKEIIVVESEKKGGTERTIKGHIVFENVSFKYQSSENYALKDINLHINPGEVVALVGYSGAGKSTLVDLIAGFWYPDKGKILIDGTDTRDLSLRSLRGHIGIVTQDIVLFNDTVEANILFGRPDATEGEVIEAAKAAYAHEFIMELSDGYETKIGERGIRFSGGQKQRITMARAILRNPSILILDEATSSLDTESEQKVQKALEKLMEGRTTIVIAHRLSTVLKATKIIVMSRGRIIQHGSHEELLLAGGLYQELYTMQFASSTLQD